MANTDLITDGQTLNGAKYRSGYTIQIYDDGYGPLWISRNSIGINGIVRAKTWEDAYGICEDEFFAEADETVEQLRKEYGFKREHRKVVADASVLQATKYCGVGKRFACNDDYPNGTLAPVFIRWQTVQTPDTSDYGWTENELFQESYGFRPNGPNSRDTLNHGIYRKDLNGDMLDKLTAEMIEDIGLVLDITDESQE